MNFCEDCGAPLSPGVKFCENCGAKISDAPAFSSGKTDEFSENLEGGVLYTNLNLLCQNLGMTKEDILTAINNFITVRKSDGIGYELFDVSDKISNNSSLQEHISLVHSAVSQGQRYLFILGDNEIIPTCVWDNMASDSEHDSDVSSDLPFATLDIDSPFNGKIYNFDNFLYVGRLPTAAIMNYLNNIASYTKPDSLNSFAMSAMVWTMETMELYGQVRDASYNVHGPEMETSPLFELGQEQSYIPSNTNLLLFNLHGSNQTEFWYGQEGSDYPEAMSHESFAHLTEPYFLAVEACYGARYENLSVSQSILLSALNGKCLSFLGSSRIAFGRPMPEGCCADVICSEHLVNLIKGMRAGQAFNLAREKLMENSGPDEIKTLAEFSLYGDPSLTITQTVQKSLPKQKRKGIAGLVGTLPDVRSAVRLELVNVDAKIAEVASNFIKTYPWMDGVKPKFYKNVASSRSDINAVFSKKNKFGPQIVSVTISKDGKIQTFMETK
ncbi:MAG: zinc-ribbon domain-containing protein [Treponema sp.]|nr:zinc-ribbon domain-containing protein [Treponema sp.]